MQIKYLGIATGASLKPSGRFPLLICLVAVTAICSVYAERLVKAKKQNELRSLLAGMGYRCRFDFDGGDIIQGSYHPRSMPTSLWLEEKLGVDFFHQVTGVYQPLRYSSDKVVRTRNLLSDKELERLKELSSLRYLSVADSAITDAGLKSLQSLVHLRYLDLSYTSITNEGLASLRDMASLEVLCLKGTQVSDDGMRHVQRLQSLRALDLTGTKVTDGGAAFIGNLARLQYLELSMTGFTKKGITRLERQMPNAAVAHVADEGWVERVY